MIVNRVKELRTAAGMTQKALADQLGVTVPTVSKWELGQSTPELETLLELADFFDLSVDALLGFRLRDGGCQEAGQRIDQARRKSTMTRASGKRRWPCRSTPTALRWSIRQRSSSTWRGWSARRSHSFAGRWSF